MKYGLRSLMLFALAVLGVIVFVAVPFVFSTS